LSNQDYEELLDYRRSVSELYAQARDTGTDAPRRCERFREKRDELFKYHPQSALPKEARAGFEGLDYYDYNPALRFALSIDHDVEPETFEVHLQDDGLMRMVRFGKVRFPIGGEKLALSLFWISGYGGGVLLPFRDATSGEETYGGGRYLLDTIKHADLGSEGGKLIIDFNYAYNPSCAYNPSWHCPLAPMENRLPVKIPAGEKAYLG
jgi:uncharacterized protein (DUF1684 family)